MKITTGSVFIWVGCALLAACIVTGSKKLSFVRRAATAFLLCLVASIAHAASSPWVVNKHGRLRLISSVDKAGPGGEFWLGMQFLPASGWHVYWKNAGDYGYPPKTDWTGSTGFENPQWFWPAPHRYALPGDIMAYGYEDEVVYPIRVTRTSGVVRAVAQISYLTCSDACVPYKYTLTLDIPEGASAVTDRVDNYLIEAYRHQIPGAPADHADIQWHPGLYRNVHGAFFELGVHTRKPLNPDSADLFFDKDDTLAIGAPVKEQTPDGGLRIRASLSSLSGATPPDPLPLAFTFTYASYHGDHLAIADSGRYPARAAGDEAWPPSTPASTNPSTTAPASPPQSLPWILVLGFLGGLILNVMPCVLPVLSIKLFGLLQSHGRSRAAVAVNALASAAGIVVSFLAFALIAILLRRGGHAVGWGIQFQQPVFVAILMVIVFAFALNLWGVFEIGMPRIFGHFATTFGRGETHSAYFASGVFATLLATPCSAPFLGTALGFSLTQSAVHVLAIFCVAGIGMALPYFALAAFPGSLRWLPKPGAWMLRVKAFLGLLLAATGIWLLMVLWAQLRPGHDHAAQAVVVTGDLHWAPFDEAEIQKQLAAGRSVFVDVTADWCFTCQANERFVLRSADVAQAFHDRNVLLMRADWTNHNNVIAEYLKKFNRAGIPFNVLYRPGRPPVLLSEFLTKSKVLDALRG
ncbi:MAG TPA: protein-disulfide reductase DsbD domain-containing protein [Elusimicrobiota bacterium]|nr:protein-disulfide reductase DsbD domain-containing protein [Elusimicrobiota bacterium]